VIFLDMFAGLLPSSVYTTASSLRHSDDVRREVRLFVGGAADRDLRQAVYRLARGRGIRRSVSVPAGMAVLGLLLTAMGWCGPYECQGRRSTAGYISGGDHKV
jgi:hypothetical protein